MTLGMAVIGVSSLVVPASVFGAAPTLFRDAGVFSRMRRAFPASVYIAYLAQVCIGTSGACYCQCFF